MRAFKARVSVAPFGELDPLSAWSPGEWAADGDAGPLPWWCEGRESDRRRRVQAALEAVRAGRRSLPSEFGCIAECEQFHLGELSESDA